MKQVVKLDDFFYLIFQVKDKSLSNKKKGNDDENGNINENQKHEPKKGDENPTGTDHANKKNFDNVLDGEIKNVATDAKDDETEKNKDLYDDSIAVITDKEERSLGSSNSELEHMVNDDLEIDNSNLDHDIDPIVTNGIVDIDDKYCEETNGLDDSSDYSSSDEDNAVEYMPDGEIVRKKSRGFKQLSNCKRFWKASLMTA